MRVDIRTGGDGVACWNEQAVRAYVAGIDERERRLSAANPDLIVHPGQVKCYGCEVMDHGYGTRCTASLTKTRFGVRDEVQPRPEDMTGSLNEIDGLVSKLDAPTPDSTGPAPAVTAPADPGSPPTPARGFRRLLGR